MAELYLCFILIFNTSHCHVTKSQEYLLPTGSEQHEVLLFGTV